MGVSIMILRLISGSFILLLDIFTKVDSAFNGTEKVDEPLSPADCKYFLHNVSGLISSPGFPGQMPGIYTECDWTISGYYGSTILFEFVTFDLPGPSNRDVCDQVYVEYGPFDYRGRKVINERLCGTEIPSVYVSPNNMLWFRYVVTGRYGVKGLHGYRGLQVRYTINISHLFSNQVIVGCVFGVTLILACCCPVASYIMKQKKKERRVEREKLRLDMIHWQVERTKLGKNCTPLLPPPCYTKTRLGRTSSKRLSLRRKVMLKEMSSSSYPDNSLGYRSNSPSYATIASFPGQGHHGTKRRFSMISDTSDTGPNNSYNRLTTILRRMSSGQVKESTVYEGSPANMYQAMSRFEQSKSPIYDAFNTNTSEGPTPEPPSLRIETTQESSLRIETTLEPPSLRIEKSFLNLLPRKRSFSSMDSNDKSRYLSVLEGDRSMCVPKYKLKSMCDKGNSSTPVFLEGGSAHPSIFLFPPKSVRTLSAIEGSGRKKTLDSSSVESVLSPDSKVHVDAESGHLLGTYGNSPDVISLSPVTQNNQVDRKESNTSVLNTNLTPDRSVDIPYVHKKACKQDPMEQTSNDAKIPEIKIDAAATDNLNKSIADSNVNGVNHADRNSEVVNDKGTKEPTTPDPYENTDGKNKETTFPVYNKTGNISMKSPVVDLHGLYARERVRLNAEQARNPNKQIGNKQNIQGRTCKHTGFNRKPARSSENVTSAYGKRAGSPRQRQQLGILQTQARNYREIPGKPATKHSMNLKNETFLLVDENQNVTDYNKNASGSTGVPGVWLSHPLDNTYRTLSEPCLVTVFGPDNDDKAISYRGREPGLEFIC